jgi:hypothetical protein
MIRTVRIDCSISLYTDKSRIMVARLSDSIHNKHNSDVQYVDYTGTVYCYADLDTESFIFQSGNALLLSFFKILSVPY